ncbi:MAG TPA: 2'-5' RNA ligase family protein [Rhizomicrobium sp.]|nr:2'-5' RNA ligase family protein [Rhizomicrobium sp.]
MPQQLSLFEVPERELNPDPLFFALLPDEDATRHIEQLVENFRRAHGLTGALRPLHVTLCDLSVRTNIQRTIDIAVEVAASVAAAPFRIAFNRAARFRGGKGERPFVLVGDDGVTGVARFRQPLSFELRKADLGKWPAAFTPHLTLFYDKVLPEDQDVAPVAWTAQEFVLVRSLVGQTRHEVLGRWPLRV